MDTDTLLSKMTRSIIEGDREQAETLARDAIARGLDLDAVIERGFIPGIQRVGVLWEQGEYFPHPRVNFCRYPNHRCAYCDQSLGRCGCSYYHPGY